MNDLSEFITPKRVVVFLIVVLLIVVIRVNLISSPSQTPSNTSISLPTNATIPDIAQTTIPDWKTYVSDEGYSVQAPPAWKGTVYKDKSPLSTQDLVPNINLYPSQNVFSPIPSITVFFPVAIKGPHLNQGKDYENGLYGLQFPPGFQDPNYSEISSRFTHIADLDALINREVNLNTAPTGFQGTWCACTTERVHIALGNGTILTISAIWYNTDPDFPKSFQQILATFKTTAAK